MSTTTSPRDKPRLSTKPSSEFTVVNRSQTDNLYRRAEPPPPRSSDSYRPNYHTDPIPSLLPTSAELRQEHNIPTRPLDGLSRRLSLGVSSRPDVYTVNELRSITMPVEESTIKDPRRRPKSSRPSSPTDKTVPPPEVAAGPHRQTSSKPGDQLVPNLTPIQTTLTELIQSAVVAGNAQYDLNSLENQIRQASDELDNATLTFGEQPGLLRHLEDKRTKLQGQVRSTKEIQSTHAKKRDHLVTVFMGHLLDVVNFARAAQPAPSVPIPSSSLPPVPPSAVLPEILNRIATLEKDGRDLKAKIHELSGKASSLTQKMLAIPDETIDRFENEKLGNYVTKFQEFTQSYEVRLTNLEEQNHRAQIEDVQNKLQALEGRVAAKIEKEQESLETRMVGKVERSIETRTTGITDGFERIVHASEHKITTAYQQELKKLADDIAHTNTKVSLDIKNHIMQCDQLSNTHQSSIQALEQISRHSAADIASLKTASERAQVNVPPLQPGAEDSSVKIKTEDDLIEVKKTLQSITLRSDKNEHAIVSLVARYNNITTEDLAKRMSIEANGWRSAWEQKHRQLRVELAEVKRTCDQGQINGNGGLLGLMDRIKVLESRPDGNPAPSACLNHANEAAGFRTEIQSLQETIAKFTADAENKLRTQKAALDDLQKSHATLRDDTHSASMVSGGTASSLANYRLHIDSQLTALNKSIEAQKRDLESLTYNINRHEAQLKTLDKLGKEMTEAQANLNSKIDEVRLNAQQALDGNSNLKSEMENKMSEITTMMEECKKAGEDCTESHDKFQEEVENYCHQLIASFKEVNAQHGEDRGSLRELSKRIKVIQGHLKLPVSALLPTKKLSANPSPSASHNTPTTDGESREDPIAIDSSDDDDDQANGGKPKAVTTDTIEVVRDKVQPPEDNYLAEWKPTYGPGQSKPSVEAGKPVTITISSSQKASAIVARAPQKLSSLPTVSSQRSVNTPSVSSQKPAAAPTISSQKASTIITTSSQKPSTLQAPGAQRPTKTSTSSSQNPSTAPTTSSSQKSSALPASSSQQTTKISSSSSKTPATAPPTSLQKSAAVSSRILNQSHKRKYPNNDSSSVEDSEDAIHTPAMKRNVKK